MNTPTSSLTFLDYEQYSRIEDTYREKNAFGFAQGDNPSMSKLEANDSEISSQFVPVLLPIDGQLDLHAFHPKEVKTLLPEYLELCRQRDIFEVRVVHGKGTGALRRTVHSILSKLAYVQSFTLAPGDRGHWGATLVLLEPLSPRFPGSD